MIMITQHLSVLLSQQQGPLFSIQQQNYLSAFTSLPEIMARENVPFCLKSWPMAMDGQYLCLPENMAMTGQYLYLLGILPKTVLGSTDTRSPSRRCEE